MSKIQDLFDQAHGKNDFYSCCPREHSFEGTCLAKDQFHKTYIVCEEGIAHNGDIGTALSLMINASFAGADAIKFQKRHLPSLYTKAVLDDPESQSWNFSYLIPQLKEVELSEDDFRAINEKSKELGLELIITPFDIESLHFIVTLDNLKAIKIASADMVNLPLIMEAAKYNLPIIISVGMWPEETIKQVSDYLKDNHIQFAFLHASSAYPSVAEDLNMRFIETLKKYSNLVGYSGHEVEEGGSYAAVQAVTLGAQIIEKHITKNRLDPSNADNKASLHPNEWMNLVPQIRLAEKSLGQPTKIVTQTEKLAKEVFAKSATAKYDLPAGHVLKPEDVILLSPGKGIMPHELLNYYGKPLLYPVKKEMFISQYDFEKQIEPREWNIPHFRNDWGLKVNLRDAQKFMEAKPRFVEFHMGSGDLDHPYTEEYLSHHFGLEPHSTVRCFVHAPEFHNKQLIDLCSHDADVLDMSLHILQKSIDKTIELNRLFKTAPPKLIIHIGGASQTDLEEPYEWMLERAIENTKKLKWNNGDLIFLPENLPRFASFFGSSRWNQYGFTRADDMVRYCKELGVQMCWDSSHCILQCNATGEDFTDYIQKVKPYISHIHLGQGAGVRQEGLNLIDPSGEIVLKSMFETLDISGITHTPEIW